MDKGAATGRFTGTALKDYVTTLTGARSVKDFGAKGDGVTDDTAALQAAINSGDAVFLPTTASYYKITDTLHVTTAGQTISGTGVNSLIRMVLPAGAHATPAIIVDISATGAMLTDFAVDHNASTYIDPDIGHGLAYVLGCAVLVMSDNATVRNLEVSNAWDNGIGIGQFVFSGAAPYTCTMNPALPVGVHVSGCNTFSCGSGTHTLFGEAGKKRVPGSISCPCLPRQRRAVQRSGEL